MTHSITVLGCLIHGYLKSDFTWWCDTQSWKRSIYLKVTTIAGQDSRHQSWMMKKPISLDHCGYARGLCHLLWRTRISKSPRRHLKNIWPEKQVMCINWVFLKLVISQMTTRAYSYCLFFVFKVNASLNLAIKSACDPLFNKVGHQFHNCDCIADQRVTKDTSKYFALRCWAWPWSWMCHPSETWSMWRIGQPPMTALCRKNWSDLHEKCRWA